MTDAAITVDSVSKVFRLQRDRAHSLKELITRRDRNAGTDRFHALDDVSLEVPTGSMYALVGHNGSGKSTLLRCIAGIYQPTSGAIRTQGRISTLLELGAGFHPDLTGRENIYMNATILGMGRKQIDRMFDEIVEFAGVEAFIDSPVKIYSSGMFVRLGFSVAVHVEPEILIIDEVIAVGDTEFQRKCFDHLYSLRKQGVTVVVVTHGIGTVETMCDEAAWLDHGVLQMTGPAPEVAAAYMDRVNEAERTKRDAERAKQDAEEPRRSPPGEATAGPDDDEGTEAAIEDQRREELHITGVDLLDDRGQVSKFAVHRERLTIRVRYEASRPIPSPVFGIALHSSTQVHITGTNTKIDAFDVGEVSGRGHVDFDIESLPLTPGDYELTVAISDSHVQHNFDRREREYRLTVREGGRLVPEGFMDLRGTWSQEADR